MENFKFLRRQSLDKYVKKMLTSKKMSLQLFKFICKSVEKVQLERKSNFTSACDFRIRKKILAKIYLTHLFQIVPRQTQASKAKKTLIKDHLTAERSFLFC